MTLSRAQPGSFRDPHGFVFLRDGEIFRQVNKVHLAAYTLLTDSGLYKTLVDEGLLLEHRPAPLSHSLTDEAALILKPDLVPFISYPFEWCFGQLRDAALATLRIQKLALDHGLSLRDASAFNIQFYNGRPVLIDLTSLGIYPVGQPWVAYRQFCQHFLAPLALTSYHDLRVGRLSASYLDGIPLDLASSLLPWHSRVRPGLLTHIHLHAKARSADGRTKADHSGSRSFSERSMRGLVESLISTVGRLSCRLPKDGWVTYEAGKVVYEKSAAEHKVVLVRDLVEKHHPQVVWDLGANTGEYSAIAAEVADLVISLDYDAATIERSYARLTDSALRNVLPLVSDLTNPTPALGWANRERSSLSQRGPADLGLALALVHHLAIGANIPFEQIAEYFSQVCRALIIEFVPKSDSMVHKLLAFREDIFTGYSEQHFEESFGRWFSIEERHSLPDSQRIIYFMKRR